ncbi:rRNA maturation RNase YbeY [Coxiella endosymbiont of Amblyomma sculptum]|uniref:rRNA maturation RNase YbeY n=1 Tax=Coxiella endosymbiont of Amblyomma sculptum TaxID=2487929 RepID=UPI00132F2E84|nr:rRNA maturation RNase YbeY [Coxiella endosymbiont of Amblyomma sculptum]QHG92621.1 rRNA maturation RNase YbeY [Coxiella endosymbiont of Amblyomma sculptum]
MSGRLFEARDLHIDIQNATRISIVPSLSQIRKWICVIFRFVPMTVDTTTPELTVRFVDQNESAVLNKMYRHKKGPTNILSFSYDPVPGFSANPLGDLAICVSLVFEEAKILNKPLESHFSHLFIHGILHLLGYDHIKKREAVEMQRLEIALLSQLGYENPYEGSC